MGYALGIFVGLLIVAWAESDRTGRVNRPLTFQDSFDSFRLIPAPVEKSTAEWDTSFVDGLDDV